LIFLQRLGKTIQIWRMVERGTFGIFTKLLKQNGRRLLVRITMWEKGKLPKKEDIMPTVLVGYIAPAWPGESYEKYLLAAEEKRQLYLQTLS